MLCALKFNSVNKLWYNQFLALTSRALNSRKNIYLSESDYTANKWKQAWFLVFWES